MFDVLRATIAAQKDDPFVRELLARFSIDPIAEVITLKPVRGRSIMNAALSGHRALQDTYRFACCNLVAASALADTPAKVHSPRTVHPRLDGCIRS